MSMTVALGVSWTTRAIYDFFDEVEVVVTFEDREDDDYYTTQD
jgi:hypothetical protein